MCCSKPRSSSRAPLMFPGRSDRRSRMVAGLLAARAVRGEGRATSADSGFSGVGAVAGKQACRARPACLLRPPRSRCNCWRDIVKKSAESEAKTSKLDREGRGKCPTLNCSPSPCWTQMKRRDSCGCHVALSTSWSARAGCHTSGSGERCALHARTSAAGSPRTDARVRLCLFTVPRTFALKTWWVPDPVEFATNGRRTNSP